MATASIGGLGGLDTAGIVSQLMQLEAVPQNKLKNRVSSEESVVRALQSLNTKLATMATRATEIGKNDAWSSLATTSSLAGVTATATAGATAASFSLKVNSVATSHGETFTQTAALADVLVPIDAATGKRTLTLTHQNGTTTTVDTGDGTLRGLVDAVNDPANASGVRATMLQVSEGSYRLMVDATATGSASSFTLTSADGSLLGGPEASRQRAGTDAEIELSGFTLTSKTNTFSELMPGVSVTLAAGVEIGKTAAIAVTRDPAKQVAAVKSFVEQINSLLSEIDSLTSYNATTKSSGALSGESAVRTLRNDLATSLYPADGTSLADLGLQTDRYGKLVFDEAAFTKAYAADPTRVSRAFGSTEDGFAARVQKVATTASDKYDGTITAAISGRNDGIARLNDSISAWDLRLQLRQTTLTRQFTALDVALGKMNSQSNWLSGQINSLSGTGS